MSTIDDHFQATGGPFSNIGFTAWSDSPVPPLVLGVWGLGATNGVFGLIDDGSALPTRVIPAADTYAGKAGVLGAANPDTGVAGIANGVGVFGQSGGAPGLSAGRKCGVLGASLSATGVVGESRSGSRCGRRVTLGSRCGRRVIYRDGRIGNHRAEPTDTSRFGRRRHRRRKAGCRSVRRVEFSGRCPRLFPRR